MTADPAVSPARAERVGLLGLGAYVPERVMTNDDWSRYVDTSDEWITERTGIRRRRIAAEDETTLDLAEAAARRALDDAGLDATDLDEIILATDLAEVRLPDTAALLQHRLGARSVPAYDLTGSGCAGFLMGLDIARSRVLTGTGRVLVVGVEVISKLMDWSDRATCVLFGDAAGAAIVGAGPGTAEILASRAGTDGSRADILIMEAGGSRVPFSLEVAEARLHQRLVMDGQKVFREAVTRMSAAAREILAESGHDLEEIALVVPHQANLRILKAVGSALRLPDEKLVVNVQDYGNTGSASVPLALWQARQEGRIAPGALVLLVSFGAGFHWAATLLRFP